MTVIDQIPAPDTAADPVTDCADLAQIAAQRDAYAQQAADLRRALAGAHSREIFLNRTIAQLREQLADLGAR